MGRPRACSRTPRAALASENSGSAIYGGPIIRRPGAHCTIRVSFTLNQEAVGDPLLLTARTLPRAFGAASLSVRRRAAPSGPLSRPAFGAIKVPRVRRGNGPSQRLYLGRPRFPSAWPAPVAPDCSIDPLSLPRHRDTANTFGAIRRADDELLPWIDGANRRDVTVTPQS
jgi:hypothetical protein